MTRAVIFDMGGTLLRFARPGNGTWREFEARYRASQQLKGHRG